MLAGRALDEDGNLTLQTGVTESFLNRGSESGGYLNRS
jgi:hypothetical protein